MKKFYLLAYLLLFGAVSVFAAFANPKSKSDMTVRSFNKSKIFTTIDLSKEGKEHGNIKYFIEYQAPGNTLFNSNKGGMYKVQFHGMGESVYHTAVAAGREIALQKGGSPYGPAVYTLYLSEDELENAWMSDGRLLVQFIGRKGSNSIVFPDFYLEYVFDNVIGPSYMSGAPARYGLFGATNTYNAGRPGNRGNRGNSANRGGRGGPHMSGGDRRPGDGGPHMSGGDRRPGDGKGNPYMSGGDRRPGDGKGNPYMSGGDRRPGDGKGGRSRYQRRGYQVHSGYSGPAGGRGGSNYGAGHPFTTGPSVPQLR